MGLASQGNQLHRNDRKRSLAAESVEALVTGFPATLHLLQKDAGAPPPALAAALASGRAIDRGPALGDFADTAAAIAGLDLVISVDTAVAHLAGALAKPVWLLLPYAPDWRWMTGRDDSPWYPTMRLFRQPAPGDWMSVVRDVRAALAAL